MKPLAMRSVPAFLTEALAASNVGTWQTTYAGQHYIIDEATAALYGVDPELAAHGVPLSTIVKALHPADRAIFGDKHIHMLEHGGLFVIEYRTTPHPRGIRWVLARGRYARDPETGTMQGRGICIDITESKLDGHVEDRAFFLQNQAEANEAPLDRAAAHALEARRAIDAIGDHERSALRQAVDRLLWAIGRALARRAAGAVRRPPA